jgi:ABC-type sugar transport system ATPase subunit
MIAVDGLSWSAGPFRLESVRFTVPARAYAVLMGLTGSGKTSLLELICGLRRPDRGSVRIGDRDVTADPPGRRRIGYVPQEAALFPTLTVREQIAFAPRRQGVNPLDRDALVNELAAAVGVTALLDRRPHGLSGGERQRIALARALAARPDVLLLDEPLAALDEETHAGMVELLRATHRQGGLTVLHVTHHRREAESLGDLILRIEAGRVVGPSATSGGPG